MLKLKEAKYLILERWIAWIAVFVLLVSGWYGLRAVRAPADVFEAAETSDFQYQKALTHLQTICKEPHPMGSSEHLKVREYMLSYLKSLGVEVEVQALPLVEKMKYSKSEAAVLHVFKTHNIVVRLRGTDKNAKAILVAAHYDSVENGPGASDDGAAVACMLEVIRLLKAARTPFKNDFVFLFSDGEEINLLGAKTFLQHKWAKDIGFVLNFEARGSGGAPILFETTAKNLATVEAYAQAAPYPLGTSAAVEVYKMMPNNTDFTVFNELQAPGLNFAYIGNHPHYHTALDNVQNLDKKTLATYGLNMLALARDLGNKDLASLSSNEDAIFFHDAFGNFWHWPASQALLSWLVVACTLGGLILLGRIRGYIYLTSVGLWAFLTLFYALVVGGCAWAFWEFGLKLTHTHLKEAIHGAVYASEWFLLAFVLLAEGILVIFLRLFHDKARFADAQAGSLVFWLLLSGFCTWRFVGISYIFMLPTSVALLGLLVSIWFEEMPKMSWFSGLWLTVCACMIATLVSPFVLFVSQALTIGKIGIFIIFFGVISGLLIGFRIWVAQRLGWGFVWLMLLLGSSALLWASLNSGYSFEQRKVNTLFFRADIDSIHYAWCSSDRTTDEFTKQFLGETPETGNLISIFPDMSRPLWYQKADTAIMDSLTRQLFAPEIKVRRIIKAENGTVEVEFDLLSARAAEQTHIYLQEGFLPESIKVADTTVWRMEDRKSLHLAILNFEGSERFVWKLARGQKIKFRLVESKKGFDEVWASYKVRRRYMMPDPQSMMTDYVCIIKAYDLDTNTLKNAEKLGYQPEKDTK
ncbi:MAG: M20/M25/M40 family metallo-hydrolase [Cytophagales bacterium]|nr:MAG: M20/M25/M40 family metallo-hydrolase [Cytophagales bacterium]TAF62152.1 MAG: M20/M25/M40 family metallo-hydrolase [Cytophagales bacterium]